MQDSTMGTNAKTRGLPPSTPAPLKSPLDTQHKLELRVRLLQVLHQSLDPTELARGFFQHIQAWVVVGGLQLQLSSGNNRIHLGKDAIHHCSYRLSCDQGFLGEIIFSRSKRFQEEELATLESLLASLVFPLRNALDYQAALRLSLSDSLTGLGNRAALDTTLLRELQLAERHNQELSLLMIDIDHFKKINDDYGHAKGDATLRAVAETIQNACRNSDISFRYGGEEFVVLLRETGVSGARTIAERIRRQVSLLALENNGRNTIRPTVSIGIATAGAGQRESIQELFERADKALYHAKTEGRNRTHNLAC